MFEPKATASHLDSTHIAAPDVCDGTSAVGESDSNGSTGLNRLRVQDRVELAKLLQRIKGQKEKARDATTTCSKTKPRQMMLAFARSLKVSTSATMVSTSDENSSQ